MLEVYNEIIALNAIQWINVTISVLALFPAGVLLRLYNRSGVLEYGIFAGVFISTFITLSTATLAGITDILLLYKIHNWAFNRVFFLFFLQAVSILRDHPPPFVWYVGIIWFAIIMFLIGFLEL
ncbi:MAG: hypothetical protein ACFFAE_09425, partial [Candidatus Hodarchaeota archaeon]